MKVFLMHRDRDFDMQQELPFNTDALIQDLGLESLFAVMAAGDKFLFDVSKKAMLLNLTDVHTITYRQNILRDCLANPSVVQQIYDICFACIEAERKQFWGGLSNSPGTILQRSVEVMQMFVEKLKRLRKIADTDSAGFGSEGFQRFFTMLRQELGEEYFAEVQQHLKRLRFRSGVLISAELGKGHKGINYTLRRPNGQDTGWLASILTHPVFSNKPAYTFHIAERDQAGGRALSNLRDKGINLVANALARSDDHILGFLNALRTELAFYIGCLNLHRQLTEKGKPVCFPVPVAPGERQFVCRGLYDAALTLSMDRTMVGNDVDANNKDLVVITGANQGGKSTFLRSVGLAQLTTQCGMFAPAESLRAEVCGGIFTHFKREEDTTMHSGKFEEELSRMSEIVDRVQPNAMILFNESFAATNEREGSEISRQIIHALLEAKVKILFVSHLFSFTHGLFEEGLENALFLRAQRQADGERTFRMIEAEPLDTSYGEDVYRKIFDPDGATGGCLQTMATGRSVVSALRATPAVPINPLRS